MKIFAFAGIVLIFLFPARAQEISGHRIAIASDVDGDWEIYLMDVDDRDFTMQ